MYPKSITNDEIKELPLLRFEGRIHLIDDQKEALTILNELQYEQVLGFDTEKKPTFVKGQYHHTALVQLSTVEEAFLFRLNVLGFFDALKKLMSSASVLKVGISIADDIKALQKMSNFQPQGFVELNEVVKDLEITNMGVRKLAGIFLGGRISKNQQTSNWENPELTKAQQTYAATDAWVCSKIYSDLESKGFLYD